MRSINIDQTSRSDNASYELRMRRRGNYMRRYNDTRYNNALLKAAYHNQFAQEGTNEFGQSYRRGSVPEKNAVFSVNYRGGTVFITPGHRATTGAPS